MGIRAAAKVLDLDFIPLANERFDLIIPNEHCDTEAIGALCSSLNLDEFKSTITHMGGYETYDTGKIFYKKEQLASYNFWLFFLPPHNRPIAFPFIGQLPLAVLIN
jgi:hypothetical protein